MNSLKQFKGNEIEELIQKYNGSFFLMKLFDLINEGAEITEDQERETIWKANKEIKNIFNYLDSILRENKKIPDFFLAEMIFSNIKNFEKTVADVFFEIEEPMSTKNILIKELYKDRLQSPSFKRELFLIWEKNLKFYQFRKIDNKSYLYQIFYPVDILREKLFEQANPNEYIESLRMIAQLSPATQRESSDDWFKNSKKNLLNLIDTSDYYDLIKNWEKEYQNTKKLQIKKEKEEIQINKLVSHIENKINPLKYDELPLDFKEKIEEIKLLYKEFIQEYKNLNEEQQFTITNIYKKRLPEVINSFIEINKEYREDLENMKNQNANDLLLKSLNDILMIFEKIEFQLTKDKIQQLSVDNKYFKEIKQRM